MHARENSTRRSVKADFFYMVTVFLYIYGYCLILYKTIIETWFDEAGLELRLGQNDLNNIRRSPGPFSGNWLCTH